MLDVYCIFHGSGAIEPEIYRNKRIVKNESETKVMAQNGLLSLDKRVHKEYQNLAKVHVEQSVFDKTGSRI